MNKLKIMFYNLKNKFKKHSIINNPSSNNYFFKRYMYIDNTYADVIYIHKIIDFNDYDWFCKYINWNKNEVFYFYNKNKNRKFIYLNKYFDSDVIIVDYNFNILKIYKNVSFKRQIVLNENNTYIFLLRNNFSYFYNLTILKRINFYNNKL